ncbi:metal ABC transporter substrate-binding protein [Chloroflexota bacterium]
MKGVAFFRAITAALAVASVLAAFPGCRPEEGGRGIKVVASIFPLADFVKNVGGDRVEVATLLRPGDSPHTYEPTPKQAKAIAQAAVFIKNGAGLEFWAEKLVRSAGNPDLLVVDTSQGIAVIAEGENHNGANPHLWLDPVIAQNQVKNIRDALIQVDPDNRVIYHRNTEAYLAELATLDHEIRGRVSSFQTRKFISYHTAWSYFARRYGLEEVAVIEESEGEELSPAHLQSVIHKARELKVKAIFVGRQSGPNAVKAVQTIAQEAGGEVILLDPLGYARDTDRDDYLKLMRYNLSQMAKVME